MLQYLSSLGLIVDFVGAILIAWDVWTLSDRALLQAGVFRFSGDHPLENEAMSTVRERRRQRRFTRWGMVLLAVGFFLQLLGSDGVVAAASAVYVAAPGFWTIFWSALFAVLVGHILAAPLAQWLWGWYSHRRGWRERLEQNRRALICLEHVSNALQTNIKAGRWYAEQQIAKRPLNHNLTFDSTSWKAVSRELASAISDFQLSTDLTLYFAGIDEFISANRDYHEMFREGSSPATDGEQSRVIVRVQQLAHAAAERGEELLKRVRTLRGRLDKEAWS